MGKSYEHLTLEERCTIARLHEDGQSLRKIAAALDRPPSTISRELKRNRGIQVGYKPSYAHEQARARRWTGCRLERDQDLRGVVLDRLGRGWSPEQVAGRLDRQNRQPTISHESIYRFIYAQIRRTNDGAWRLYLPRAKYKRGWRARSGGSPASLIERRISIDQRPRAAQSRRLPGHWEADLMLFSTPGQVILVATNENPGSPSWQDNPARPPTRPPVNSAPGSPPCRASCAAPSPSITEPSLLSIISSTTNSQSEPSSAILTVPGKRAASRTRSAECDGLCLEKPTSQISAQPISWPASWPTITLLENASASYLLQKLLPNCCTSNVNPHPRCARDDNLAVATAHESRAGR